MSWNTPIYSTYLAVKLVQGHRLLNSLEQCVQMVHDRDNYSRTTLATEQYLPFVDACVVIGLPRVI